MEMMVDYVHRRLQSYDYKVAVDFTLGQGNDTLFLQKYAKKVISFDIQQIAIDQMLHQVQPHVQLICDSHSNCDQYLKEFDVGIFNLGYLPNGNHHITTTIDTTSIAIQKAISMMKQALFIVVYVGHDAGKIEANWIDEYVSTLDNTYNVSTYRMMNKNNSPYVIEIERKKK